MSTPTEQREQALAAADGLCPRCGEPRAADQEYCVECGLRLPRTTGRLAGLRRRWVRRLGWYPGDWVWVSLVTLLVAVAGAAVAIAVTHHDRAARGSTVVAPPPATAPAAQPPPATTAPATTTAPRPARATTAHATTPAPTGAPLVTWPARSGWTIVLVSYPSQTGVAAARQTALRASHAGLEQVGVLDSSRYASLQPGYLVVFAGIYGSQAEASAGIASARQAGYPSAYVRHVAR